MAKRNNMPMRWNRRLLPALLLCLACACTNRPKDVLDMRDMTDVLVDIHTLDGVFASTSYSRFQEEERDAYYEAILVRHHITKAQFDSSLLWYSRDPKKFEKVYTRVIDQLTAEEAAVKAGKYHELLPKASTITHMDLWTDSTRFTLRGDSLSRRPLAFSVADTSLVMGDVYELRFLVRVGTGDSCPGLHTHFNLHYAGGRIDSIYLPLHADSLWRRYTLRLRARQGEKVDSLYGRFLAADSCRCARPPAGVPGGPKWTASASCGGTTRNSRKPCAPPPANAKPSAPSATACSPPPAREWISSSTGTGSIR